MLDKRKIRLMIKMASYEKQGAEEDLKISSYYKKGLCEYECVGYGNLVYHRLCNRSGTDRILHVGADSGKAYDTKASSLDGNGSRRLSDSFDSLLYRCKDVLQEKTQSCQAACEKILSGSVPS